MSTQDIEPLPSQQSSPESPLPDLAPYKTAILQPRLTPEERESLKKPKVIIVGAGIGGVMLGNLLQKGGIDFQILERSKDVKPLGSAMSLGSTLSGTLEQLNILEEFKKIGKPYTHLQIFNHELESILSLDMTDRNAISGGEEVIVARPDLYDLLLRQIPKENIDMGKKVASFVQGENGVIIRCSDNTTYEGDILVGADGAHSAVRQHMYSELKKEKRLPSSDDVPLPYSYVCLVGQTEVLDPEEFPDLKLPLSQFLGILGNDKTYSVMWKESSVRQISKNTVCWSVVETLNQETFKTNDAFCCSEWGSEAAEAMCKEVRHFQVPGGKDGKVLTIGDLIDRTPKGSVSKVMLEEKLNPAGGAGALTAMHDAIALANWICAVQSRDMFDIEDAFKEYREERLPVAKEAFENSRMFDNIGGKGFVAKFTRTMMKHCPRFLWRMLLTKMTENRGQATFLPLVEDKGTSKPKYGASYYKTLEIQRTKAAAAKRSAQNSVTAVV
ncbi:hypothetical protein BG000_007222 [Podila horticola]|nr:hypothetical protein BG000_007222 [Podila horticola]